MKNNIFNLLGKLLIIFGMTLLTISCNDKMLQEVPKGFLSPENAYVDLAGFETAITTLHSNARSIYQNDDSPSYYVLPGLASDEAVFGENFLSGPHMDYSAFNGSHPDATLFWQLTYKMIGNANTIISRSASANIKWSDTEKAHIVAEARFFRAWGYRLLGELYGGVPIIKSEVTSPKVDFVRNTRTEVYQFIVEDLKFASANLPDTESAPGRITKAASNHLLAEINICLQDYQGAIDAASLVINNPNYALMTQRFGKRTGKPGDVYWDLFQRGNQNRADGNKEAIWVIQWVYNTPGGGNTASWDNSLLGWEPERAWGPRYFALNDPNGKSGMVLSDTLGRPVGWNFPTYYFHTQVWQYDWNDIRNSKYNIKRDFYYNNPTSAFFGKKVQHSDLQNQAPRYIFPMYMKITDPYNHPDGIINSGQIWKGLYAMRLAETYLLRAEAYLGKGDKANAAADINVVRTRANAKPVSSSEVDINFILDERVRELATEELRTLTLTRLGLLYDRVKNYSKVLNWDGTITPSVPSTTIQPYNNLWPIPQSEIDLNIGAKLQQNPGYVK